MNWVFVVDIAFYAFLGLVIFIPVVTMVAAIRVKKFSQARKIVMEFLNSWATIAPDKMWNKIWNVAGISTVLLILGFGAYVLNRAGDAAMPHTSTIVQHFGDEKVRWSIEHANDDWSEIKFCFREITEIRSDRLRWEKKKGELGKYDVRFFRTLFFLFVIFFIAAIIDISRSNYRTRGFWMLGLAVVGITFSQWLWIERKGNYVENLVSSYESSFFKQYKQMPALPASYPNKKKSARSCKWKGCLTGCPADKPQ